MLPMNSSTQPSNWTSQAAGAPVALHSPPLGNSLPPKLPHLTFENHDDSDSTEFDDSNSSEDDESDTEASPVEAVKTNMGSPLRSERPRVPPLSVPQANVGFQRAPTPIESASQAKLLEDLANKVSKLETELGKFRGTTPVPDQQNRPLGASPLTPSGTRLQPPTYPGHINRAPSPRQTAPRIITGQTTPAFPELAPRSPSGVQFSPSVPPFSAGGHPASQFPSAKTPVVEISAVDLKWGPLFDERGAPTKRWEQVVRGFGQYILDEFMPQKTLVIAPQKMAAFYSQHSIECEAVSFLEIFRSRKQDAHARLSELYDQLGFEYHLVPSAPGCRPTVPGLTLHGWTQWMTLALKAYPDEEARRFAKVITMLPINAESPLDGKLERLPKQISRHLLPEKADPVSRGKFSGALRVVQEALELLSPPPKPGFQERRPSQSRAASPRSRYKPSSVGVPSPPSSVSGAVPDDDYRRGDRDRERERSYREPSGRPYESNGSVRRDPPLSRSTTGLGVPTRPPSRTGPPSTTSSRRRSSPPPYHRSSVSGASGREERGYTRSSSDATIYPHRSDQRERDRERERERERDRERDRDRDRDTRDSKARGREREADRRDRGSRRSASVVSNTDRKGPGGLGRSTRRSSVVVQDDRAGNLGRAPTWGDFFAGKSAMA
ncbi:hypothetical protein QBC41DRAFT_309086 [Cercophora samala]|uniref:DUF7514 domain-containing protein n=1 Tax=Cercophora samala TaxID=330535 RepID=A0AA39ZP54_9PEZI|nr:hypothetical protein QBC41DRAFT_309086 [Cercophora samala]